MPDTNTEKVAVFATHGPDDPERASLPFVMGNGALVMDVAAVVILQGNAVLLAKKAISDHVFAPGLPPLHKLIETFVEQGGKILVCTPCIRERKLEEAMLIETAEPIAAARAIQESLEATAVLNY